MSTLVNVGVNSLKRRNFSVMADKVLVRLRERGQRREALEWCRGHVESLEAYVRTLDPALWAETVEACRRLDAAAQVTLANIDVDLGGGGHYPLLYFLTRYLNPAIVMETGVAAGWSSQAVLLALRENGAGGRLYSSDFPYFRYRGPERLIGLVVDEELKNGWMLYIDGDKNNLPRILEQVGRIGLFHYDSDKSYSGREYAIRLVEAKLADKAIVIFDDIQNNFHFRDYVGAKGWPFRVFEFQGKYVGLTGPFLQGR